MDSLTNRASAPAKTMARNVMVIGAGKIDTTVASLLASAGYRVTLADRSQSALDRIERNGDIRCVPLNIENSAGEDQNRERYRLPLELRYEQGAGETARAGSDRKNGCRPAGGTPAEFGKFLGSRLLIGTRS